MAVNSANLPKARPIEDFWAQLKLKVFGKQKLIKHVEARIRKCLKEMDQAKIKNTIENLIKRLDDI